MTANQITQRAFNAGYLIEKYLPKLSQLLLKGFQDKNSAFAQGFVAGSKEMELERTQNKAKFLGKLKEAFGNKLPSKSQKRDDREKDIDI